MTAVSPQPKTAYRCRSCGCWRVKYATIKQRAVATELWRCDECRHVEARCQCGAKIYELVDGKVAVAVGSTKSRRLRMVVEQESGLIECRCRRVHRL